MADDYLYQCSMEDAACELQHAANERISDCGLWRTNKKWFKNENHRLKPGCIDMSPAYYAIGQVATLTQLD